MTALDLPLPLQSLDIWIKEQSQIITGAEIIETYGYKLHSNDQSYSIFIQHN